MRFSAARLLGFVACWAVLFLFWRDAVPWIVAGHPRWIFFQFGFCEAGSGAIIGFSVGLLLHRLWRATLIGFIVGLVWGISAVPTMQ